MHPVLRLQTALPEQRVVVDTVEAGQALGGGMTAESQVYLADATGRVFSYATAHGALWPGPLGGGADCGPRRSTGGGASRHPATPAAVWWVLRGAGSWNLKLPLTRCSLSISRGGDQRAPRPAPSMVCPLTALTKTWPITRQMNPAMPVWSSPCLVSASLWPNGCRRALARGPAAPLWSVRIAT